VCSASRVEGLAMLMLHPTLSKRAPTTCLCIGFENLLRSGPTSSLSPPRLAHGHECDNALYVQHAHRTKVTARSCSCKQKKSQGNEIFAVVPLNGHVQVA
jgi:hypothetical protein